MFLNTQCLHETFGYLIAISGSASGLTQYYYDNIIDFIDKNDTLVHKVSSSCFLHCCNFIQQCMMPQVNYIYFNRFTEKSQIKLQELSD